MTLNTSPDIEKAFLHDPSLLAWTECVRGCGGFQCSGEEVLKHIREGIPFAPCAGVLIKRAIARYQQLISKAEGAKDYLPEQSQ